ncbi:MAG: GNAT family N-acetyltransferase [Alphaproteobacteria bacterium]|nr:GNAT family N-acetyltransferase [Alphaproteobacteria bacterium]
MRIVARRGKAELCRSILADLEPWFGIPEARDSYADMCAKSPLIACDLEGELVGFVALAKHGSESWELAVMGVRRTHHRRGIGRALLEAADAYARESGARFLTVKTLATSARSHAYSRTRWFYRAMGLVALEVFPTLWGPDNLCLLMAKALRGQES